MEAKKYGFAFMNLKTSYPLFGQDSGSDTRLKVATSIRLNCKYEYIHCDDNDDNQIIRISTFKFIEKLTQK